MPEDIKQALYAVLGRKKLGKPDYIFQQQPGGGRGQQRFKCHLTVAGIAYTGLGNSTSKKDAQSNAAMDFGHFLVREGLVTADELPQLQLLPSQQSDTAASSSTTSAASAPAAQNPNFIPVGQPPPMYGQPPPMNPAAMEWDFTGDSVDDPNLAGFSGAGGFGAARIHRQQQLEKSWHDQYVEQKAEQVSQSEAVDMTAEIHGGWTMENCKQALNEFCQKNLQPIGEYKMGKTGTDNDSTFVAEQQIFLAQQNRTIFGRGQGSSQKVAKTSCALNIVRQLFHIGLLPAVAGAKQARKKNKADDLPPIKVEVDQGLVERVQQFLGDAGVQPVDLENFDAEPAEEEEERVMSGGQWKPRSLLIDQKLENFPESEHKPQPGATVAWAPPLQNWNAWRAANIDTQPIAFWPMDRISEDLRMREKAKELPARMRQTKEALPVFKHRDQIIRTVTENPVVLIKGSTGCGKSTQICQYLLESHLLDRRGADFNCYVTQPRRISAITLAERVAMERCEQLGDSIGYSVRFEGVTPRPYGAVMFVTVGVLMRRMEAGLRGISHVIIDEIHERDINTDFLLIAIRDMVQKNQKLRVLLMSATIDTNLFTNYFGHCPIIEIEQRVHPVQHFFLEDTIAMLHYMPQQQTAEAPDKKKRRKAKMRPGGQQPAGGAQNAGGGADDEEEGGENSMSLDENLMVCADNCPPEVKKALGRMSEKEISFELIEALLKDIDAEGFPGSILIFLPGWQLISLMWNRLSMHPVFSNQRRFVILPLHSQLSAREQHRVFEPVGADRRKIILSTNLAETSVTIDDVVYVIDSCRVREKMYTSRNNLVHFANVWASRTNLLQRRGRAGRVRAGFCFHLITKARFQALEEHRTAEMLRTPLHEITLTIKLLHLGSAGDFLEKAVQPPPIDAVVEAEVLLREMNALDRNLELTELGRILARLPIEPKLGKMVLLGAALGIGDLMLTAAAATSFNSPFVSRERFHTKLAHIHRSFSGSRPSDHIGLVNVNQQFQAEQEIDPTLAENFCYGKSLSYPLLNMTQEAKRQLNNILIAQSGLPASVFAAYPIDVHGPDPNLDVFLSLLIHAYYPNICYMRDRRRVFTLEQAVALLGNMSVCVPFAQGEQLNFASPLFMFTEKLRTSCISCKQVSMISPLQLLLFGCRKVEALGPGLVRLDNMIPLEMPASVAAKIVALRPCLEALVVRTCLHPEQLSKPPEEDQELVKIVRELSSDRSWLPTGERGRAPIVPGTSGNARTSAKKEPQQQAAYPYSAADQHAYATPQLPRMPWQMPPGPGPFPLPRPGKRPWRTSTGEEPASQPPAAAATGYADQPMPMVPVLAGQEAIAAANGLAATAATEPLQDFSTMAGYGPSNYYGSGLPGSMEPQRRQPLPPLEPNGFFEPNGHQQQQPQQHHTHMFRGTFPRNNNGPRGRGRRGGRAMGRGGGGNIGERGGRGGGGGGAATRAVARGRGFPRGRQRHHPPPA